nr:glutamate receptor 2.8 [Quercus suber]
MDALGDSTNGKKLREGVLVKDGFFESVQVEHDASANTTNVKGYSIDIFKAIIKALPYNVDYEFIHFAKPNGESVEDSQLSNLARIVVIIWVFVVLILTQSYTANLTSLLTIQQLQPTVIDVSQLLKNGDHKNVMNFYQKEVQNGGIAAAFDEIPCIKILLSKYCSKYTMVQSISKTDGFGFVFPKGSHFISDVSRAILNVTEGEKMKEIAKTWLGDRSDSPSSNTQVSSGGLSHESFWGLFLIASLLAVVISFSMFLYKERRKIWIHFDSKTQYGEEFVTP